MSASKSHDRGLRLLDDLVAEGSTGVTSSEIAARLGISSSAASNLVRRLVEAGLLERIRRGTYAIRPVGLLATRTASSELGAAVAAAFGSVAHRIGYRSALDEHELLTHPARTIQVASANQVRLRDLSGRKLRVVLEPRTIVHLGAMRLGESWLSDLERAVLDAARRPELVGGVATLAEALVSARDDINTTHLVDLASRLRWQTALRRIGSVVDRLAIAPLAGSIELSAKPQWDIELEPSANVTRFRDRKWRVRWHIDPAELRGVVDG
jgi:predicted transcriptional regulator of viral defense system